MKKIEMSKLVVPFVIVSIFYFTYRAMQVQISTGVELSPTLIVAFYGFCTGELWLLAGIKKTKIKNGVTDKSNDKVIDKPVDEEPVEVSIDEPVEEDINIDEDSAEDKDFNADDYDIDEIMDEIKKGDNYMEVQGLLDDVREINIEDLDKIEDLNDNENEK